MIEEQFPTFFVATDVSKLITYDKVVHFKTSFKRMQRVL